MTLTKSYQKFPSGRFRGVFAVFPADVFFDSLKGVTSQMDLGMTDTFVLLYHNFDIKSRAFDFFLKKHTGIAPSSFPASVVAKPLVYYEIFLTDTLQIRWISENKPLIFGEKYAILVQSKL